MPWDESHVKVFEMQKPQRMAVDIARSGCYERAVAILRNTEQSGTQQATAEALHRLLTAAGAGSVPAEGSQQDAELKHQEQLKAEAAWQDKLQAKANRQQLRRERQQQRHEQSMALRRHKYVDKVNALQKAFEDRVTKQKEQQTSSLRQVMEQQRSLQQQLASHQESLAHSLSSMPVDNNEQALTTLQLQLKVAQSKRGQAEKQLQLACQTSEEMSRRAASIEPEDGECTPSPIAAEQSSEDHRHEQGQVPTQPMDMTLETDSLPPPPAVTSANMHSGNPTQQRGYGTMPVSTSATRRGHHSYQHDGSALPPPPPVSR